MRSRRKGQPRDKATASPSLALVLVDGTKIRKQIKQHYEKAVRDLAKARDELEHFQETDVPQFSRWVSNQFGAILTEIRNTARRIQEFDQKLAEMEREVVLAGVPPGRAYQRVMNRYRQEEKQTRQDPNEETRDEADDSSYSSEGRGWKEEFADIPNSPHAGREKGGRLKELYRALVRRLHPDTQEKQSPKKLEWWHQAQQAYEKGDEEQLEVILTLCEIEDAGSTERASLSLLQRITAQFKKNLRQIRKQLEKCRRDPAWQFSKRSDLATLASTMKEQLLFDLDRMREELQVMEEEMAMWAAEARRGRARPVYRRRRTADPFEPFF